MGKSEIVLTIILFNLFFILFLVGVIVFVQQYKLKKKEHLAMLTYQKEEHQRELLENQLEIQNQTMQHIGREIHDNVGQKLTLASLYTQQLAFENKAPHINATIENISNIINQSLTELRSLSKNLTDNNIKNNLITNLIEYEFQKVDDLKICTVQFSSEIPELQLNYQTKSVLLRIVQEFLQNSVKHAKCQNIIGHLTLDKELVKLLLFDDGIGFDTSKKFNGIGLQNIKKRTEIIGGKATLTSDSQGTRLIILIPNIK